MTSKKLLFSRYFLMLLEMGGFTALARIMKSA